MGHGFDHFAKFDSDGLTRFVKCFTVLTRHLKAVTELKLKILSDYARGFNGETTSG